ncbi:hypothetical protein [Singulisphaera acidiphila]|uniref:Uncharacterized protein n=1 Tax=Singulisphaera acidiphila (strain ATCC BAA-1392 / DSM 18658 / VKM B-2454 / MOB10) TaxID=886293 RepID=L0DAP7_SINAD|nr:hypothetical protein [Singulisphaera acidiphila]AGA26444.1 hypothetical protein Sinac_2109 [Singulisphaera acidiphila DSM 18658]
MTIHLPKDVEIAIEAAVQSGHFASVDDALAVAWRNFQQQQKPQQAGSETPDPLLGSMRDYADEMDEIVADAMKQRREEPWRVLPGE